VSNARCYFLQVLTKFEFSGRISIKVSAIKFHENLVSRSLVDKCGRKDRHVEANRRFLRLNIKAPWNCNFSGTISVSVINLIRGLLCPYATMIMRLPIRIRQLYLVNQLRMISWQPPQSHFTIQCPDCFLILVNFTFLPHYYTKYLRESPKQRILCSKFRPTELV